MINPFSNPLYLLPPLIGVVVIIVLAVLVWQKARQGLATKLFLGLLASMWLWCVFTYFMRSSPDVNRALVWDRLLVVAALSMFVFYLHFTFAYARTKGNQWVIPLLYLSLTVSGVIALTTDLVIKEMIIQPFGYSPVAGPFGIPYYGLVPVLVFWGAYNLLKAYRTARSSEERNRLLYLAIAVVFPVIGAGLDALTNLPPASIWGNLAFCIVCTVAIVRYHLLDIRILIKKSLAYLILSALIAIPYAGVLYIFTQVFKSQTFQWWGHVVIVLVLAIILRPLYTESQELVDRLFYRDRYDYLRALERLTRESQNITDLEKLGSTLTELISGALHTGIVHLLLASEERGGFCVVTSLGQKVAGSEIIFSNDSPIIEFLRLHPEGLPSDKLAVDYHLQTLIPKEKGFIHEMGAKLLVPIFVRQGQLSGVLVLGEKLSEQPYSDEDMRVLGALSGQMAMALENARLYHDAVKARENLEVWLNSMSDLVVIVNNSHLVQFMNRAAQERLGVQPGKFCWQILEREQACIECPARQNPGSKRGGLHQNIRRDEREYDVVSALLLNPDGSLAVIEVMRDITGIKQAEEALKASEGKFRNLFENSPVGMAIATVDGRSVERNNTLQKMLGYDSKEEFMKTSAADRYVDPGDRKHFLELLGRGPVQNFEVRFKRKDGTPFWVSMTAIPLKDEPGGKFITVTLDITERKQAEEALRVSEAKFRDLVDNVPVGIGITTLEGRPVFRNKAILGISGFTLEELMKIPLRERYENPKDWERYMQMVKTGSVKGFEAKMKRKDGTSYWASYTAIPQKTEFGDGYLSITQDITERKQTEAKMREMELKAHVTGRLASVGEMAAGIAHEINNPLTPILGFAEMLMKRELPEDVKDDLQIIRDSAKRAADVMRRLLTFARQFKPMRTLCNISEVIETTLELRAYHLKTNNIKVITELDPELPQTMADAGQLQQVVLNLIMNAEFEMSQAHKGGNLLIKTEVMGDIIRVTVKDDGPGISEENMGKLFQPFFTTKRVGEGTGLGLSVCHGIVVEHNGKIYAESKFGKGATFIVELPVITQEKEETVEAKLSEPDTGKAEKAAKAKILVVDDEPSIVQLLERALTEDGYEVKTTGKAKEALKLTKGGKYALILLDIKLPDMSGIEMYEQLDKTDKSLTERIIFVTGDVLGSETINFFSRTGASYITKPFDIEQLKKEIKSKLSKRK